MKSFVATLLAAFALPLAAQTAKPLTAFDAVPWQELFNGKDLSGFHQLGGKAKYEVKGEAIVGTSVAKTPNTFLATDRTYANFILEYEFKVEPKLNSGVQVRSHSRAHHNKGQVHGTQIEIDVDNVKKRYWAGGIYEEGRRGWLVPVKGDAAAEKAFTEQGARLVKPTDWNHVRVEAIGNRYRTFLNGESRADLTDDAEKEGFIALQVHAVPDADAGKQVMWRNLRIKVLPADARFPAEP